MKAFLQFVVALAVTVVGYQLLSPLLGHGPYLEAAFFTWSLAVTTGASGNPLDQAGSEWKYKYLPYDCIVEIIHRATQAGGVVQITSGSDEIQQESPVSAGGTAGVLTGRLNVEPVTFRGKSGDLIIIKYRNTAGTTTTFDGSIELTKAA